jgi:hypothetical protein
MFLSHLLLLVYYLSLVHFFEERVYVPLVNVAHFIASVKNTLYRVVIHAANWESDRSLLNTGTLFNFLQFVIINNLGEKLGLANVGSHGPEVEVAVHVGRDNAVCVLQEFADFNFDMVVLGEHVLNAVTAVVVNVDVAVVTSSRDDALVCLRVLIGRPHHLEVYEVDLLSMLGGLMTELAEPVVGVVVVEESEIVVPGGHDDLIFDDRLIFFVVSVGHSPVNEARDNFFLLVVALVGLFKTLDFLSILNVDRPGAALLITHK